jgi:hypothetical protein
MKPEGVGLALGALGRAGSWGELFPQEREPGAADVQELDAAHRKHGLTTVATPTVAALDEPPQKADAAAAGLIRMNGVVTPARDLRSPWWLDSQMDEENRLRRLPLPACDHSAGDLAVFSIHFELPRR